MHVFTHVHLRSSISTDELHFSVSAYVDHSKKWTFLMGYICFDTERLGSFPYMSIRAVFH